MSAEMGSPRLSLAWGISWCAGWVLRVLAWGALSAGAGWCCIVPRNVGAPLRGDIWRKSVQATWTRFGHEWRELSRSPVRPGIATRWRSGTGLFTGARLWWFAVLTARTWRMR